MSAPPYVLVQGEEDEPISILRPDGDPLYRLAAHDLKFAQKIVERLNAQGEPSTADEAVAA